MLRTLARNAPVLQTARFACTTSGIQIRRTMRKTVLVTLALITLLVTAPTHARLTRLEIEKREAVAAGQSFGNVGAYEKLTGRAYFEVDPAHARNTIITDIKRAPVNANGHVEFAADVVILKPVHIENGSRTLFFEVNNRGNKISFGRMHDTAAGANLNDPTSPEDFGNAFLMRRGHVLAWVGWGADVAPGDHRLTVDFPLAIEDGKPVNGFILTEFSDRNFNGGNPTSLPLSGSTAFKPYPAVSTDKSEAKAQLFMLASDSPDPSGPEIPRGAPVADDEWAFADCPEGWPGTPSVNHICLKNGFLNNRNYHLLYVATNAPVMGLGYATTRDFISFLKNQGADDAGNPNPVMGLTHVLCQGISSSGMYLRDFTYQGFNVDETNRKVCDGMHIHAAGVHKLYLNYRFAQPNAYSVQHRERFLPDTNFPRQYSVRVNPFLKFPDGILKRPIFDPLIIHTDTSSEYWQFRASLTGASEGATMDFSESSKVRRYLLSSVQHRAYKGEEPHRGIANRQCEQLSNPVHPGPILRALVVALEQWVKDGTEPPEMRVPKIADQTLVSPDALLLPKIPGLTYNALHNGSGDRDFGPRVRFNRGAVDLLVPDVIAAHKVLVPQVDNIGNEVAGIRHPFVEAPTATLLGWNTRTREFGGPDLCDLIGSMIPLAATKAEAETNNDARPSLEELYGDHAGYVAKVAEAARKLQEERLLLPADVDRIIAEAEASDVLK